MIGWATEAAAKKAYLANYTPDWKCGPITAMTVPQFKAWLERGDQTWPVARQVSKYAYEAMVQRDIATVESGTKL
jgi:hypothetical protein